ncbi:hypothetical protein [Dehalococcoides mccartyi]|uniref:hypothetical protein n=1 Tax=Dehalococcoides mccartyi TaxID=61435 RepID=UPI00398AB48A
MSEDIAKIQKPESNKYTDKKKLYVVPLVLGWKEAPPEYEAMLSRYWKEVGVQLAHLESRIGSVNYVFHESVDQNGIEGLDVLTNFSPVSKEMALRFIEKGATVELTEDNELVRECLDWERFMVIGFTSQNVSKLVSEKFIQAVKSRYEFIRNRISEIIKENQAGVLFIREGNLMQFPTDIEVFSVAPPVLDEIHRWLRERRDKIPAPSEGDDIDSCIAEDPGNTPQADGTK